MDWLGNKDLLKGHKTAFLCSRRCPASVVLKAYDWATSMRAEGRCVLSGNHSQIEKDVVHYLLKGNQPVIIALARGLKKRLEPELAVEIEKNRLLIVTPYKSNVTRVTQETANKRNEFMAGMAEEIVVAFVQPKGNLEQLVAQWISRGKKISTFDVPENKALIEAGVLGIR